MNRFRPIIIGTIVSTVVGVVVTLVSYFAITLASPETSGRWWFSSLILPLQLMTLFVWSTLQLTLGFDFPSTGSSGHNVPNDISVYLTMFVLIWLTTFALLSIAYRVRSFITAAK